MRFYWSLIILKICIHSVRGQLEPEACAEEYENVDEINASRYLWSLTEKHGAKLKMEARKFTEDPNIQVEQVRLGEEGQREWHVGEVSLTQLDKTSVSSLIKRLERTNRLPWKMLIRSHLADLGLFFVSVADTNIFEEL